VGKVYSIWESTQLRSSSGIIGTIATVMTKPNRQNRHTVMEVEGTGRLILRERAARPDIWVLLMDANDVMRRSYWRWRCDVHHTLNVFLWTAFSRSCGKREKPTAMTLVSLVGALGQAVPDPGIKWTAPNL
jgi:hypothetical protein